MLDGSYRVSDYDVHAVPGEGTGLTPWVFGSSKGQSAQVAGARGLPFVASYHITPGTALEAIDAYRAAFTPSAVAARAVRGGVGRRGSRRRHRHRAAPRVQLRPLGVFDPGRRRRRALPGSRHVRAAVRRTAGGGGGPVATQFVGDPDEVADRLEALQRVTDADELVITSVTHRHADRLRSHELIAKRWGLAG